MGRPVTSRNHLLALDALRGMLAILVVLHHDGVTYRGWQPFSRGYLAVDFFFLLSGFVIALRYEPSFARGMSPLAFMRIRWRRLWPLMAIGVGLGAAVMARLGSEPAGEIARRGVAQLLFLPWFGDGDWPYRLNGVEWSLTFELAANLAHGGLLWRLRDRQVAAAALVAAVMLVRICADNGGLIYVGNAPDCWGGGFARIAAPYLVGVLIARWWRRQPAPSPGMTGLAAVCLAPILLVALDLTSPRWWVDLLVVFLAAPGIVLVASRTALPARFAPAASMLGALSYPLYVLHLPVIEFGTRLGVAINAPVAGRLWALAAIMIGARLLSTPLGPAKRPFVPARLASRAGAWRRVSSPAQELAG